MYAIGDTPYGPFDAPVKCYDASGNGTRVAYNAKAHPHLSDGDKLLISYNVNVEGAEQWTVDYHPCFIELDLDPGHVMIIDTPVNASLLATAMLIDAFSVACAFIYILMRKLHRK